MSLLHFLTLASLTTVSIGSLGCQSPVGEVPASAPLMVPAETYSELTIDRLVWSDSEEWPEPIRESFADRDVKLHAHIVEWGGFSPMKDFTRRADKVLRLVGDDGSEIQLYGLTGGLTSTDGSTRFASFTFENEELPAAGAGVTYRLIPRNKAVGARWVVLPGVTISR